MLSATCFILDQSKILSSVNGLTKWFSQLRVILLLNLENLGEKSKDPF